MPRTRFGLHSTPRRIAETARAIAAKMAASLALAVSPEIESTVEAIEAATRPRSPASSA